MLNGRFTLSNFRYHMFLLLLLIETAYVKVKKNRGKRHLCLHLYIEVHNISSWWKEFGGRYLKKVKVKGVNIGGLLLKIGYIFTFYKS